MRDQRVVRCTYYIETDGDPRRGAEMLAGEQSSGTFVAVPGETDRIRVRHACRSDRRARTRRSDAVAAVSDPPGAGAGRRSRREFPMENIGTDLATLHTTVAGNLFELVGLFGCRLQELTLPDEFIEAHPGPAFVEKVRANSSGAAMAHSWEPSSSQRRSQ